MEINSVGIVGMGALGLLYGSQIKEKLGNNFPLFSVMDQKHFEKNKNTVYSINGKNETFVAVNAQDAKPVDLVMVCVKSTGLNEAVKTMKNLVGPQTIILSVMNGISSEQIIGKSYGMEHLVYCVAQGMDAMKFGDSLKFTRKGKLLIGPASDTKEENVLSVKAFFEKSGIDFSWEEDILYRMWGKFMLNVGINQTCMVYGTTYSGALEEGSEPNRSFIGAMREVLSIANAEHISLTENDLNSYVDLIKTLSPEGTPSMGQDRINRKPSEVESFAGTVIKIAEKHSILVPVNQFLYTRVKEIEKEYVK